MLSVRSKVGALHGVSMISLQASGSYANQLPVHVEALIVPSKKGRPHWGARKISELLPATCASPQRVRCMLSSIATGGLPMLAGVAAARPKARRFHIRLLNELWCVDFKGEFKLGNGRHGYPLTSASGPRAICLPSTFSNREGGRRL